MSQSFFDHFKKEEFRGVPAKAFKEIFFQICFDAFGAYLIVTDHKGKQVETSYLNYSGATRNVLRTLEGINEKNDFVIDWEKPQDHVYLQDYPFLMESLRHCDNLINENKLFLHFAKEEGKLRMLLKPDEDLIDVKVQLLHNDELIGDFKALTESFVLAGDQIIEVAPLGVGFQNLMNFQTTINASNLALFLSILYSNLENVDLVYEDFRITQSNEKIDAQPCLIFEKIDENNALYLRAGQVLADLDVEALSDFDLYRFAEINDLEKTIAIKLIRQEPMESIINQVLTLLKKHQPKKKKAEREEILLEENLFIVPEDTAANFIYNEIPNLLNTFAVFGAEKLKTYKINTKSPKLSLQLGHNIDFFEGDVSLDFDGEKINLFDVLSQYNKQRYVKLSDGSHALLNEEYVKRLERLFKKKSRSKKAQLSFFDLPLAEELIEEVAQEKVFKKSRAVFEGFNKLQKEKGKLPEIKATLRPYQVQGYHWLEYLKQHKLGGCLADDMGLGKTLQTIALMAADYPAQELPSLVVMPKSLLFNWEREVKRFAPQLQTYTFYGTDRDIEEVRKAHLVFTTYAIMRNEVEKLKEETFHYVILDESQNIKNLQAQTTKAALLLKANHRLALSGTPIENNLAELYSLFRFLNPSMFGSVKRFNDDFLTPIQKNGNKEATMQLRKKIYPFVLRRLKKDVLADLPDKIEQVLLVEMSDPQKRLYHERREFYQMAVKDQISRKGLQSAQFFIFQALNELRQIATVPEGITEGRIKGAKRELLTEQLLDAVANGHKVLIFVNFLAAIESIGSELNELGIDFVSMTGATQNRQALVNRFQTDPDCKVFLMTLKTGGVGLNLTAADTIFIYDPWWNKAAENQAIDRAHRIGQQNKVLAYKLIAEGTIEEKILQLQELKRELFDNVISSDSTALKSLSEEDINVLLAGNA